MVFTPSTYLGRLILILIASLYIFLLVLNLVSFGSSPWITYTDVNVQFGLWRVCSGAVSASRTCSQWSGSENIVNSATNQIIFQGKPGFVQSAQGLEIVSLIFYVAAGILLILGFIDRPGMTLEHMFIAATVLLFLCGEGEAQLGRNSSFLAFSDLPLSRAGGDECSRSKRSYGRVSGLGMVDRHARVNRHDHHRRGLVHFHRRRLPHWPSKDEPGLLEQVRSILSAV